MTLQPYLILCPTAGRETKAMHRTLSNGLTANVVPTGSRGNSVSDGMKCAVFLEKNI